MIKYVYDSCENVYLCEKTKTIPISRARPMTYNVYRIGSRVYKLGYASTPHCSVNPLLEFYQKVVHTSKIADYFDNKSGMPKLPRVEDLKGEERGKPWSSVSNMRSSPTPASWQYGWPSNTKGWLDKYINPEQLIQPRYTTTASKKPTSESTMICPYEKRNEGRLTNYLRESSRTEGQRRYSQGSSHSPPPRRLNVPMASAPSPVFSFSLQGNRIRFSFSVHTRPNS